MYQLDLFEETSHETYAVIFCSNIMKDQFGVIWERQEIVKSNLTLEDAKIFTAKLNSENLSRKNYFKFIRMESPNLLIY